MTEISLVNGQPVSSIPITDRGFSFGDGLFETILVVKQQAVLLDLHLQRLQKGCQVLQIDLPRVEQIQEQIQSLAAEFSACGILKLIVTRGEGRGGYATHSQNSQTTIAISLKPFEISSENAEKGIRLFQCEYRIPNNSRLAGIKHLNRLDQVMARLEWQDQYAEGLMQNQDGHVIEGTMTNLFIEKSGQLVTPHLSNCGVEGVMRKHILSLCEKLDIPCHEGELSLQIVKDADGIFVCNSVRGIWPVTEFAAKHYSISTLTRSLQRQIANWYG